MKEIVDLQSSLQQEVEKYFRLGDHLTKHCSKEFVTFLEKFRNQNKGKKFPSVKDLEKTVREISSGALRTEMLQHSENWLGCNVVIVGKPGAYGERFDMEDWAWIGYQCDECGIVLDVPKIGVKSKEKEGMCVVNCYCSCGSILGERIYLGDGTKPF